MPQHSETRREKEFLVDVFTSENPEIRLDDWLPALNRAASWNGWSDNDRLLQLAGHLRGRALQEWDLLEQSEKSTFIRAVESLRLRRDMGSKTMAAQEFRHCTQARGETIYCRLYPTTREDFLHRVWP